MRWYPYCTGWLSELHMSMARLVLPQTDAGVPAIIRLDVLDQAKPQACPKPSTGIWRGCESSQLFWNSTSTIINMKHEPMLCSAWTKLTNSSPLRPSLPCFPNKTTSTENGYASKSGGAVTAAAHSGDQEMIDLVECSRTSCTIHQQCWHDPLQTLSGVSLAPRLALRMPNLIHQQTNKWRN